MTTPAPEPLRLVGIRDTPLDVAEVVGALGDDGAGGLALFIGRVRDHDDGKAVTALNYSAHPTALTRLQDVCRRVSEEHDVCGVAAVHRIGQLAIGDLAVIVAATAVHRGDAFVASRALIDTLKAEVPIWKRQAFDDKTEQWVGTP